MSKQQIHVTDGKKYINGEIKTDSKRTKKSKIKTTANSKMDDQKVKLNLILTSSLM